MDEHQKRELWVSHRIEQIVEEHARQLPAPLKRMYDAFKEQGFTDSNAIALTQTYLTNILSAARAP